LIMVMTVWVIVGLINGLNSREEKIEGEIWGDWVSKREKKKKKKKLGVNPIQQYKILFINLKDFHKHFIILKL